MTATFSLFERWKARKGYGSDSAGAEALGVTRAAVSLWRQGRNGSAAVIERMAKDLGEDPVPVILQAFAEAAKDADDKRTLGKLAKRLGAACVALLALAPWSQPATAQAQTEGVSGSPVYTLCEMAHNAIETIRAWFRAFAEHSPCNPLALYPVRA